LKGFQEDDCIKLASLNRCFDISEGGKDVLLREEEVPFWFEVLETMVLD